MSTDQEKKMPPRAWLAHDGAVATYSIDLPKTPTGPPDVGRHTSRRRKAAKAKKAKRKK